MKKENDTPQTRKVNTMKKSTFVTIKTALTDLGYENEEVFAELDKEINRGEEQKAKNAEAYEAMHDVIVGNLEETPVTCGELYDAIKDELPDGATKGKVQYALTHLWQDEIVIVKGTPNSYRKA